MYKIFPKKIKIYTAVTVRNGLVIMCLTFVHENARSNLAIGSCMSITESTVIYSL